MIAPMHGAGLAETTAFVAVVELKSFTKAAKQLAFSPPRVSEMVRNIEERLGVRLIERTTRSVAPTTAGERLRQFQCRLILVKDRPKPVQKPAFLLIGGAADNQFGRRRIFTVRSPPPRGPCPCGSPRKHAPLQVRATEMSRRCDASARLPRAPC